MSVKKQAIIFDFGGVIATGDKMSVVRFVADALGVGDEEASSLFFRLKSFLGSGGTIERFWTGYATSLRKMLPDRWIEHLEEMKLKAISEVPGMKRLIRRLKAQGIRTALLSNIKEDHSQIVRRLGYYRLFSPVQLSFRTGVEKPDPQAFHLMLEKLGLPAEACIFVDDSLENVESARKMGIDSILFTGRKKLEKELILRGILVNPLS